ncbi:hypothetical protein NGM36_12975 [Streptomyces mutabilis]|uniref:nSTAND1 domain-containing NTPase n=1 Tax=Streptomyces mutabilis TaxID=67332 RepID=UPI0022BA65CE|nr:hypothetical protein [Streptomyces mutabilis]MCZ9350701.1 hypothetical protein [Streptomyces mutabilis]
MGSALTRDDPERIGGYWLAARLGAGGQGVVYEAYDASGTRYALKTLHREADPFLRDRFAREAEAARRVAAFCTARILKDPQHRPTASDLLLGLVGATVEAADPRAALMEAGARKAAAPAADAAPADNDASPSAGAGHTVVEAPLGERAEAAFAALTPAAQLAAHELLLRLTVPGSAADGSQDSVRTAGPAELLADRPESERLGITAAVQGFAAAGVLLTDTDGSVRPAGAALLPAWRRLRAWIDTDRQGIDRLQRIGAAARSWQAHGERPEDLLRGTESRDCLDRLPTAPYHLRPNPLELRFLTAGRTAAARTARRCVPSTSGTRSSTSPSPTPPPEVPVSAASASARTDGTWPSSRASSLTCTT